MIFILGFPLQCDLKEQDWAVSPTILDNRVGGKGIGNARTILASYFTYGIFGKGHHYILHDNLDRPSP